MPAKYQPWNLPRAGYKKASYHFKRYVNKAFFRKKIQTNSFLNKKSKTKVNEKVCSVFCVSPVGRRNYFWAGNNCKKSFWRATVFSRRAKGLL